MDIKAFRKIVAEAEEAIGERRLSDALALIQAVLHDCRDEQWVDNTKRLSADYEAMLHYFTSGKPDDQRDAMLNRLFRQAIEMLQGASTTWQMEHMATPFGRLKSQLSDITANMLIDQLKRTMLSPEGEPAYYEALDSAFGMIAYLDYTDTEWEQIQETLLQTSTFTRQVLISALMLSTLYAFSPVKLQQLMALGYAVEANTDNQDVLPCTMVALTVCYVRYQPFFTFYPRLYADLRAFFEAQDVHDQLPQMLHAVVCQGLTERVGKKVDDILPIIKEAIEKQQPRLGRSTPKVDKPQDENGNDISENPLEIHVTKLEGKEGRKWFRKLASHARQVDAMRKNDFDVNHSSFTYMKEFNFFYHPAHWFYPYSEKTPIVQKILFNQGQRDNMTASIMNHNRFCASDRYSYLSMMGFIRKDGPSVFDQLRGQMDEEDTESFNEMFQEENGEEYRLNAFSDYCQTCYRFFRQAPESEFFAACFALNDQLLLPRLPLFEGLFAGFKDVAEAGEALIQMGENERAIVLLDNCMEHTGSSAALQQQRGYAFMQMQMWQRALTAFQQAQLIEEEDYFSLLMARCHEALGQWEEALKLLEKYTSQLNEKDPELIEEMGRGLIQLGRWDEAAQRFFELEFMDANRLLTQRGIAWCSLHQGKYERAEQYYRQLIAYKKASWEDRLNLAHALWFRGKTAEAVEAYRQFVTTFNRTRKEQRQQFAHWTEAFQEDARTLLQPYFSPSDIALMLDAITLKA